MTDKSRRDSEGAEVTMYRASAGGGLEPFSGEVGDYRDRLRSRRWDAAPLENPEVESTDPRIAVAFIVAVLVVTFIMLVVGYASGFWG